MSMKKLLGVTGCPTGIAHTYMAEEALKMAAEKYGCQIKVETNGAVGVENALTAKDIQEADGIIVACDKKVDVERFNGKPVIEVSVSDGINRAEELVKRCLDGKAPIRGGEIKEADDTVEEKPSLAHTIYKHLMNGVSHMLPLVVAGGVLTAISFLWGIYSFDPSSPQYNVLAANIKEIGGYAMNLMVPVLAAFIAQSISDKPGLLAGMTGGMIAIGTGSGFIGGIFSGFFAGYFVLFLTKIFKKMPRQLEGLKSIFIIPIISVGVTGALMLLIGGPCAALNEALMRGLESIQNTSPVLLGIIIGCMCAFDMGGPVNKAAYVTGTMLLGEGNYYFMAGVSAACITPPLIIAIAATFFKNRFSEEDRTAGLINYILGCTHITEGAIPFAAKNPLKVIPVLMAGSSISATLTYICKIQVPAPHGGFLILPLVSNPLLWVGCILVGSVVGALLYVVVTPKTVQNTKNEPAAKIDDEKDAITKKAENDPEAPQSLYSEDTVKIDLKGQTKDEVIREMADVLDQAGVLNDKEEFIQEIIARENLSTTDLGMGFAIPHAKTKAVNTPRVAVGTSKEGFDFQSEDGHKSNMIFMIATTDQSADLHLKTLSELSMQLIHPDFRENIMAATTPAEIIELLENN